MKKVSFVLCLCVFTGVTNLWAQPPDSLWSCTYGGSQRDYFYGGAPTSDGGYILAGVTESFGAGAEDFWLVKTDVNGNSLWSHRFGGPQNDRCYAVIQTSDGGYAMLGFTFSYGAGDADVWLVRTNESGDSLWSRTYGGPETDASEGGLEQTPDGGFMLLGWTGSYGHGGGYYTSDMWLIRTDADGNMIWNRTYGGGDREFGKAFQHTSDGGLILVGTTYSYGGGYNDGWLLKTNANGDSLWSKASGWPYEDGYNDIRESSDGGYIAAGWLYPSPGVYNDAWLVRADSSGDTLWTLRYGYPGLADDAFRWVSETPDGGFAVAGWVNAARSGWCQDHSSALLLRTNAIGDLLWTREFVPTPHEEVFHGGVLESDESYALWGYTASYGEGCPNAWLVRTGSEGPRAGYVTLEIPGPMDWDYRLHWVSGSIYRLVFRNICPGTHGSCCDGASALGWHATDYPDSVVFTSPNPLTSGSLVVFRLYHPYCSDQITWVAGDSSGLIEGPLPVELMSFTAVEGDQQITLQWETASETDNDYFEIHRDAVFIAQVESEGNPTSGHEYSWTDPELVNGVTYAYTLIAVDMSGIQEEIGALNATPRADSPIATEYALLQNCPNPFNASTEIRYAIPEAGHVTLTVFNAMGQVVATLVDADQPANTYAAAFDASALPSGIYIYALSVNGFADAKKMVLIK